MGDSEDKLQVSDRQAKPSRIYTILGCTSRGCGKQDGSWRAFTFYYAGENQQQEDNHQLSPSNKIPDVIPGHVAWGTDDGDWGAAEHEGAESNLQTAAQSPSQGALSQEREMYPAMSRASQRSSTEVPPVEKNNSPNSHWQDIGDEGFDSLLTQLGSALTLETKASKTSPALDTAEAAKSSVGGAAFKQVATGALIIPEFFLHRVIEPTTGPAETSKEQHHINELLQQYQLENGIPMQVS